MQPEKACKFLRGRAKTGVGHTCVDGDKLDVQIVFVDIAEMIERMDASLTEIKQVLDKSTFGGTKGGSQDETH